MTNNKNNKKRFPEEIKFLLAGMAFGAIVVAIPGLVVKGVLLDMLEGK